jgi:hypothetical protein
MKLLAIVAAFVAATAASAQTVTFDFDGGPPNTGTPLDQISGGITAHFSHESAYPYAIWPCNVWGFTPVGFSGYTLWPATVYRSDLYIDFSTAITSVSLMYAPEEYATDSSAMMRISGYSGGTMVGTNTHTNPNPGTWPTDTLALASGQPFDRVVVHYEHAPVTGGDYGPIFAVDNIVVTPVPEPASIAGVGLGLALLLRFRRRR